MTWELKGVAGPTAYPRSTVVAYPFCQAAMKSDNTAWVTVQPYACCDDWTKAAK
jgi:hypothetical protein